MTGVTFNTKHSANDWNLFLTKKIIGLPEMKGNYIELPGANGTIDLTDYFGDILYNDRTLEFDFDFFGTPEEFETTIDIIENYLHGKKFSITLDTDPNFYYYGRSQVSRDSEYRVGKIVITSTCEPFKYSKDETLYTKTLEAGATGTLSVTNDRMPVIPTFIVSTGPATIRIGNDTYQMAVGTHKVDEIVLGADSTTTIQITASSGTGTTVKVKYRKGRL